MVRNYIKKGLRMDHNDEKMATAVRRVKARELSVTKAARIYGIPYATLHNRVHGKYLTTSVGRSTAIPKAEEEKLANCLRSLEKWGLGLSRKELLEAVCEYVKENKIQTPFKNNMPGEDWFLSFRKRHKLSIKKPQAVENARYKSIDPFSIAHYFDLLHSSLKDNNILDRPDLIFNMDESSVCKDPSRTKIVGAKGASCTRRTAGPGRLNLTILCCAAANGSKLPPQIIFKGKNVWDAWLPKYQRLIYPGMSFSATKNGWMEKDVFKQYFTKVFLPNIPSDRPCILIYDGHASHIDLSLIQTAIENKIIILKLPPHTSHMLQPLDLSVFKAFKVAYDELLVKWQRKNIGKHLPNSVFVELVSQVWTNLKQETIVEGFRKGGIYPFNRNVVPECMYDPQALERYKRLQKNNTPPPANNGEVQIDVSTASTSNDMPSINDPLPQPSTSHDATLTSNLSPVMSNDTTHSECESSTAVSDFESLLLKCCKQNQNVQVLKMKKNRVASSAEVITSEEFVAKLDVLNKVAAKPPQKRGRKRKNEGGGENINDEMVVDDPKPVPVRQLLIPKKPIKLISSDESNSDESSADESFDSDTSDLESSLISEETNESSNEDTSLPVVKEVLPDSYIMIRLPYEVKKNKMENKYFVCHVELVHQNVITVKCMRKSGNQSSTFHFPTIEDKISVPKSDIVYIINSYTFRRGHLTIKDQLCPLKLL